jgi:hypothetical protein
MATTFHVYDSFSTYRSVYKNKSDSILFETDVKDFYIKGDKLWIVTNTNLEKERPDLSRSIVHFRNNDISKWEEGDERLVKYEESRYNPKTDKLEFCTRHFRKPLLIMRVGRFHGDKPKKPVKLDWTYRMYDISLDRINLVLCNG